MLTVDWGAQGYVGWFLYSLDTGVAYSFEEYSATVLNHDKSVNCLVLPNLMQA